VADSLKYNQPQRALTIHPEWGCGNVLVLILKLTVTTQEDL